MQPSSRKIISRTINTLILFRSSRWSTGIHTDRRAKPQRIIKTTAHYQDHSALSKPLMRASHQVRPHLRQLHNATMSIHTSNGANGPLLKTFKLEDLPKSNVFTRSLPADGEFPTPTASHAAERSSLGPRQVKNAAFTYVRPDPWPKNELLSVSKRALQDLAIDPQEANSTEFARVVSGERTATVNKEVKDGDIYPWAQCYGGYQFGSWAGQLGDGRAISLFETTNPNTGERYELQLKGAGKTPYSRFADGRAVLRSSIREYIVSEALNALGVPTTRALSLTLAPESRVRRERMEPGAIVARFAQTWLRFGTFDLARSRGDRKLIRQLADYAAEEVFGGWENLPARIASDEEQDVINVDRGVAKENLGGSGDQQENRYARLYREIARRNAKMVAWWQAYAFTNGVLNTDNTSIYGLSIDFGPFAFLDNFDPDYTPNHDDHMLRYSYKNQPTMIWWNLVRLGEALGELIGAGGRCDEQEFVEEGVSKTWADELVKRAETLIDRAGDEYKSVFLAEYKRLFSKRLGLKTVKESDFQELYSELLDTLQALELDFNHTFRKLSSISVDEIDTQSKREDIAGRFFHHEGLGSTVAVQDEDQARSRIADWLDKWRLRITEDWSDTAEADAARSKEMKSVNPNFVPRSWILDEVIDRVEKKGEREILDQIMEMALSPFNDEWSPEIQEEANRFCGDVPRYSRAMQCSCSS